MRRRHREEKQKTRSKESKEDVHIVNGINKNNDEKSAGSQGNIFPRFSPWIVCLVTAIIRVNYVINPENWWILHPDEIFQSLEVAHSEVFGYGFRAYEYLPGTLGARESSVRESELNLGMSSMRSFMYPRFFILLSWVADVIGLNVSHFLLWKIAHTCITSLLPVAVYYFAVVFYKKRTMAHDIGVTAAIMTASSVHLSVFGTHTLLNSFLATPAFCALSVIWQILEQPAKEDIEESSVLHEMDLEVELKREKETSTASNGNAMPNLQNGHATRETVMNGNITHNSTLNRLFAFLSSGVSLRLINKCFIMPTKVREHHVRASHRSGHCAQFSLDKAAMRFTGRLLLASFLLVLCCYIRIDIAVFAFATILPHITKLSSRSIWGLSICLCGSVFALFVAVTEDTFSYKYFVVSPYSWLQFNVFRDLSSTVFGRMDCSKYFIEIFLDNAISIATSCIVLLMFIFNLTASLKGVSHDIKACWMNTLRLFVSLLILLALYSTKGHKEIRFMHNFLVLLCLFYSGIFVIFIKTVVGSSRKAFAVFLSLYVLSQWHQFPSSQDDTNKFWTFESSRESQHVVRCMDYLRQQNDVTGVFVDNHIHTSGGYTVLHHNVPIMALVHYEFFEFSKDAELNTTSIAFFSAKNIAVKTFSETSNFITLHNTPLLLRELILNKQYNYLILGVTRQFLQMGYREVYRSGTIRILKRQNVPEEESQLKKIALTIPIGSNATILEYEGSWLVRFKRYYKAAERLASSINLETSRVGAFQLLAHCFFKMGQNTTAKETMLKCVQLNGKQNCNTPRERIILHEDYVMK